LMSFGSIRAATGALMSFIPPSVSLN
jgi:hypothetical protein